MKQIFMIATAALFAGSATFAQSMQDWDTDTSGDLSRDEWTAGLTSSSAFSDWDADANNSLEAGEFASGLFQQFDADSDGTLTSSEWDDGFDNWYEEQAVDLDFSEWDSDGDGALSENEFKQQYESSGLFDQYRTTTNVDLSTDELTEDEFADSMFDWMDSNRDDSLVEDEYTWFQ